MRSLAPVAGTSFRPSRRRLSLALVGVGALAVAAVGQSASASRAPRADDGHGLGDLLLSRTVYTAPAGSIIPGVTKLPAGCTSDCVTAVADGGYPEVFNNESVDPSFGVSSPILLDRLDADGRTRGTTAVPATGSGTGRAGDHLVTSFPSKSELALNTVDGWRRRSRFMGYVAPVDALDVSNSNTPGVVDPTNPVGTSYYRAVARLDRAGHLYLHRDERLQRQQRPRRGAELRRRRLLHGWQRRQRRQPAAGRRHRRRGCPDRQPRRGLPESAQLPGQPTPVGSFSVTQLGDKADKIGKDTNFRGLTVHDNVVYLTKGSGGNGVNTVYFIDTTGTACPSGVGLPVPGAPLPTTPIGYDPATLQTTGLANNMCILKGFPTALKSTTSFPFGMWFANSDTLYVADEGNGDHDLRRRHRTATPPRRRRPAPACRSGCCATAHGPSPTRSRRDSGSGPVLGGRRLPDR